MGVGVSGVREWNFMVFFRSDVWNSLVPSRNATSREGWRARRGTWVRLSSLCESHVEWRLKFMTPSLIIEREGAERAMLGSLVGASSPPGMLRCSCFLTWNSHEPNLHKDVLCLWVTFSTQCFFPFSFYFHGVFCYWFYFLFIVLCFHSTVVSLCHFLSLRRLFNSPFLWFLIHRNGYSYCYLW